MAVRRKQEPKALYSIRLGDTQLKQVDDLIVRWHSAHYTPGFSGGEPPVLSRAQVIRWALDEGMLVLDRKVAEDEKGRKEGAR